MFEDSDFFNLIVVPEVIDEVDEVESEDIEDDSSDSDNPVRMRYSSWTEHQQLEDCD